MNEEDKNRRNLRRLRKLARLLGIEKHYKTALLRQINIMVKDIKTRLLKVKSQNEAELVLDMAKEHYDTEFTVFAEAVGNYLVNNVSKKVDKLFMGYKENFKLSDPYALTNTHRAVILDNIKLIKTIPRNAIEKIEHQLVQSVGSFDQHMIMTLVNNLEGKLKNNAKTIARDQVAKAMNALHMAKSVEAGFEYYEWFTMGDERVSVGKGGHKYLDGRIYRFDKATAVVDAQGNFGHPSTRVNCRCTYLDVITESTDKFKLIKDKEHGDYYVRIGDEKRNQK